MTGCWRIFWIWKAPSLSSLHIQSVDQVKAIKTVKRKITDLDKSKIEEQKKAVRAGYDLDISLPTLPPTGPRPRTSYRICRAGMSECSL